MNSGGYIPLDSARDDGRKKAAAKKSKRRQERFRKKSIIYYMHLSKPSYNLSARNFDIIHKVYDQLCGGSNADGDGDGDGMDDIMFKHFINAVLKDGRKADDMFELFDTDMGNSVDFDEFYLCVCILIAIKDNVIGHFFEANTRVCFDLLDTESLGMITKNQTKQMAIILDMTPREVMSNFEEFDTSHDEALDYEEFRLFALRCIDNKDASRQTRHAISDEVDSADEDDECCVTAWETLKTKWNSILLWVRTPSTY